MEKRLVDYLAGEYVHMVKKPKIETYSFSDFMNAENAQELVIWADKTNYFIMSKSEITEQLYTYTVANTHCLADLIDNVVKLLTWAP